MKRIVVQFFERLSFPFLFVLTFSTLFIDLHGQELKIILIGDAGKFETDDKHPVVDHVLSKYNNDIQKEIIFLGDNIYPLGLPSPDDKNYNEYREILDRQIQTTELPNSQVSFIPGNHDWAKGKRYGLSQIINQQNYVNAQNKDNLYFYPNNGCPGPEFRVINDKVIIIYIDSQWWLQSQDTRLGTDSDCENKTGEEVILAVNDLLIQHKEKIKIIATHHPVFTYGEHNGAYTVKDHIFPLTALNNNLYIPLPGIGSIYPLYRTWFGNIQDSPHPVYKELSKNLHELLKRHPFTVHVAGHEHSLQYIQTDNSHYVVSGSGAKTSHVKRRKKPSLFSAEENGYAVLDIKNNQVILNFFDSNGDSLYSNKLFDHDLSAFQKGKDFGSRPDFPESIDTLISQQYEAPKFKKKMFGENYRDIWSVKNEFRVFDITQEKGGLKIIKRGGGQQTKSLRLEDSSGIQYVLRSVNKFPESAIPELLKETVAKDIVQDQISASNPYAAITIPPMAEAIGIPHAEPELVWLPDDPALGIYQKEFANNIYLFERREPKPPNANPEDYDSTDKVLENLKEDNDNYVDQKLLLKARLLDLVIADWDRHDDQWRWAQIDDGKGNRYIAIPRDRDQAYFVNEGFIPKMASRKWLMPKFQGFDSEVDDVNTFMFNGRYFDRTFLNELDKKDWLKIAEEVQSELTDDVIKSAMEEFPKNIPNSMVEEVETKLKARRDALVENAVEYYEFISKAVDIYTSDKHEKVEVKIQDDGEVRVEIKKITNDRDRKKVIYERKFDPEVTKELRLYTRGGEDVIEFEGDLKSKIKIRVFKGAGQDTLRNETPVKQPKIIVYKNYYDSLGYYDKGKGWKVKKEKDPLVYNYDRKTFKYDILLPLVSVEYNVDDGIFIGGGLDYIKHKFRKSPYALRQRLSANYAFRTNAFNIRYSGDFIDVFNNVDLNIIANFQAPNYVRNFFGFGNETEGIDESDNDISYYRARVNQANIGIMLSGRLANKFHLKGGLAYQYFKLDDDDNVDNFIDNLPPDEFNDDFVFNARNYIGLSGQVVYNDLDHPVMPKRGIRFLASLGALKGITDYSDDFGFVSADLSFYWTFKLPGRITWATRFGGGYTFGDYAFFQAQTLGGTDNLRGYRRFRFSGDGSFYNNTEIRTRLFSFNTYLFPASIGMVLFHDIGRVWYENEDSDKWHRGYGGGIYISPLKLVVLTVTLGYSEEELLPYVTTKFQF
ncbi:BamA/TamA family outer membrane protein [Marinigracilibium pacificum]|uniref:BamA/TamA family outer membrane protein n=1 Tax=Marinigracilibium pacificum TaxID=2729599 RepID=A0A848J1P1_9BACT|nr:BamA/TamA family outer membrane protein [Marinigracilibium pacificum]NMM48229.1 BamA/TamA family outer membrane protein [Marinigracilibium pacificum]